MRAGTYGRFGPLTRDAVLEYRARTGLGDSPAVDAALLADLVRRECPDPVACRGYLTLALECEYTPLLGLVALTCLCESGGRFACLNLNTDRQGLSFGVIQWAQRPGRLREILSAFHLREPAAFEEIAGDARGLVEWTGRAERGRGPAHGHCPRQPLVACGRAVEGALRAHGPLP